MRFISLFTFTIIGTFLFTSACISKTSITVALAAAEEEEEVIDDEERQITSLLDSIGVLPKAEPQGYNKIIQQNLDGLHGSEIEGRTLAAKEFIEDRRKTNTHNAVIKRCNVDPEDIFCVAFKERWNVERSKRKYRGISIPLKQVQLQLKNKDFIKLENVSSKPIITAAKKLKIVQLREVSSAAVAAEGCLSDNVYSNLAFVLETDFPQPESVELARSLQEKLTKCSKGEVAEKAMYRLAMFNVWKNQCSAAVPLFEAQLKSSEAKYLQSRSTYWREWCNKQVPKNEKTASQVSQEMFREFPLSFHSLVADDGFTTPAFHLLTANPDPPVQFRSTTNKTLNSILDAADIFMRLDEKETAFHLLEGIKQDHISAEPAEVLLYISIVADRAQFGLLKFQVMSKAFEKNPAVKTPITMKFYYPNWYYELVEEHKDKVNPYLLLALIRQESAFNPKAQSGAGAKGLMQLLPRTARSFARVRSHELFIPKKNVEAGAKFFSYLLKRFNGQVHLALAAYNAGPSAVDDWIKRYPTDNSVLFMDLVPYRETREYVATILRNWYWYNKLYAGDQKQSNYIELNQGRVISWLND